MKKVEIERRVPHGTLKMTLPHSFQKKTDGSFVCYIENGKTMNSLGYGNTKQEAFDDLVRNKREALNLDGIRFDDWLYQFNSSKE